MDGDDDFAAMVEEDLLYGTDNYPHSDDFRVGSGRARHVYRPQAQRPQRRQPVRKSMPPRFEWGTGELIGMYIAAAIMFGLMAFILYAISSV